MLSFLIIFSTIKAQEIKEEKIYSLLLIIFKNDTVVLEKFSVEVGMQSHFPSTDTGYYIQIISYKNERLFKSNLGISFTIHYQTFAEEPKDLEKILINIRLPYFEEAERIEIYHGDSLIFSIKICNFNSVCEPWRGETFLNCRDDCSITTPSSPTTPTYLYLILIGSMAVLIIFLMYKIKVVR